jgi:hypothetical protein
MRDDLDTSFRWPTFDERFGSIVLATTAVFSLVHLMAVRTSTALGENQAPPALAALPHDLGLTWSELMHKYGCDGTDPDTLVCKALVGRRAAEERAAQWKKYEQEASRRTAKLVSTQNRFQSAIEQALAGITASAKGTKSVETHMPSGPCTLGMLCPRPEPVHVACAREKAPRRIVTGWIRLHIAPHRGLRADVRILESTLSHPAVGACIASRLSEQRWLPFEQEARFSFDDQ